MEQAGAGMLALERDANSQTVINDVFRAVHTLKGSSGLFDVSPLTRLVHAAEDLLGEVRTGDLALNSDIVDRLLDSLDVVGRWIDALEAREQLPGDAEATMTERVDRAAELARSVRPRLPSPRRPPAPTRRRLGSSICRRPIAWPPSRRSRADRCSPGRSTRRKIVSFAATIRSPCCITRPACSP